MPPRTAQKAKPAAKAAPKSGKGPGRKGTVKPPLPVPERLKKLFTSLCAQIDGGHFTNAIKTCDKSLFNWLVVF
jgi:signal recognition particle subunit SRP72